MSVRQEYGEMNWMQDSRGVGRQAEEFKPDLIRTNTFTSTTSSISSTIPSPSSSNSSLDTHPFAYLDEFGLGKALPRPIINQRAVSMNRVSKATTSTRAQHSRHASVQSGDSPTRCSSGSASSSTHVLPSQRTSSPISIATTFGGEPRNNGRSRTSTAQYDECELHPTQSYRSERSNSFKSYLSRQSSSSTRYTFPSSPPGRFDRFSMPHRVPPRSTSRSAVTPDFELGDPMDVGGRDDRDNLEDGRSGSMRTPVRRSMSLNTTRQEEDGERDPPARPNQERRRSWLFGRQDRKGKGRERTELSTVPEENKTSPLKAAWNRSIAKFGASSLALDQTDDMEEGNKSTTKLSGFSSSERLVGRSSDTLRGAASTTPMGNDSELPRFFSSNSDNIMYHKPGPSTSSALNSSPLPDRKSSTRGVKTPIKSTHHRMKRRTSSTEHASLPRRNSLPLDLSLALAQSAVDYLQSPEAEMKRLSDDSRSGRASRSGSPQAFKRTGRHGSGDTSEPHALTDMHDGDPQRSGTLLGKVKYRLSRLSLAANLSSEQNDPQTSIERQEPASHHASTSTEVHPERSDDNVPDSVLPLSKGNTASTTKPGLSRSNSSNLRMLLNKLGKKSPSFEQQMNVQSNDVGVRDGWKRHTYSASMPCLDNFSKPPNFLNVEVPDDDVFGDFLLRLRESDTWGQSRHLYGSTDHVGAQGIRDLEVDRQPLEGLSNTTSSTSEIRYTIPGNMPILGHSPSTSTQDTSTSTPSPTTPTRMTRCSQIALGPPVMIGEKTMVGDHTRKHTSDGFTWGTGTSPGGRWNESITELNAIS